jgi:hypothetical protein
MENQLYAHEPLAESSDENEQEEVDIDGILLQEIEDRHEGSVVVAIATRVCYVAQENIDVVTR